MIITRKFITFSSVPVLLFLMSTFANAYVIEFPSYYGLDLKFSGTVTESYSNNITYNNNNENKQEDFLTKLFLGFDVKYTGKKRSIGLSSSMERHLFLNEDNDKIPTERLNLYFDNEFSNYYRISITNDYSHTQVPYTFEEEFGRYKGKYDRHSNKFNIRYSREISKEITITTGYSLNLISTDLEGADDSSQNSLNVNAYYAKELNRYNLSYSYSARGRTNVQQFATGLRRDLTKNLFVEVTAGLSTSSIGGVEYTNENYSVALGNEILLDERTSGYISYSRRIQIVQDREGVFDNWRVSANLKRDILEELIGNISIFYGQGSYLSTNETEEFLGANAKLNYNIWEAKKGQKLSAHLGYTYSELNSNDETRGYQRGTADLGIAAQF